MIYLVYPALMLLASFLGLLQNIIYAKLLAPHLFGYFTIVITVASFGVLLQAGLLSGLMRELPVVLGRADPDRSDRLVGQVSTVISVLTISCYSIYAVILFCIPFDDGQYLPSLLLGGLLAISEVFFQLAAVRLRCEQRFFMLPIVLFIQRLLTLILGSIAAWWMSYCGPPLVSAGINILLYLVASNVLLHRVRFRAIRRTDVGYLIRIGFPSTISAFVDNLRLTMDRLFLARTALPRQLGVYQFSSLPLTMGLFFNSMLGQYLTPKLLHGYGAGRSIHSLFRTELTVSLAVIAGGVALIPFVLIAIGFAVPRFFPEYSEGIPLMQVFVIGMVLISGPGMGIVLNALNRQSLILLSSVAACSVSILGFYLIQIGSGSLYLYAGMNTAGIAICLSLRFAFAFRCVRKAVSGTSEGSGSIQAGQEAPAGSITSVRIHGSERHQLQ